MDQKEERKSLLALLPNQQALNDVLERERGSRRHVVKGQLTFNLMASISSNPTAQISSTGQGCIEISGYGGELLKMAHRSTMAGLGSAWAASTNARSSASLPNKTLGPMVHLRKRKRLPSQDGGRPAKHLALPDWARGVSSQADAFTCSNDLVREVKHRLLRTKCEQAAREETLSAANSRVREATAALEDWNEQVAAADYLAAIQEAARVSATRFTRRAGDVLQSKILETINAGTTILTASLRGVGLRSMTPGETHEGLARAKEALQGAEKSAAAEKQVLKATASCRQKDERLLREQEGLQMVHKGLAIIQSLPELWRSHD